MISSSLFGFSFFVYVLAFIAGIVFLVNRGRLVERAAFWLFAAGFLAHTVALLVRWAEAGDIEVAALEEAESRILQGWEWFETWISHPPWSNLYESLVCFGWGVSLVSLYGIRRFNIPILPVFAIGFALVVMGAASLLINQQISPLIPALQSKWIHLHVTMATVSYPAFGLAAILGLFYLLKTEVKTESFGVAIAVVAILTVSTVGGQSLFSKIEYRMPVLSGVMGEMEPLRYSARDAAGEALSRMESLRLPLPGAGALLMLVIAVYTLALAAFFTKRPGPASTRSVFNALMAAGFGFLTLALAVVIYFPAFGDPISLDDQVFRQVIEADHTDQNGLTLVSTYQVHGSGSALFSLKGSPFEFMLLLTAWLNAVFYFFLSKKRAWLVAQLPSAERLDELSYKTILFAFPFLTLLIITGAIWAYYAWGRYWGWDPKETWSLVTWIVYSIYLHVRLTRGWEGKIPAAIAILGFGVVIFTYLGVNILVSGLHSYATG